MNKQTQVEHFAKQLQEALVSLSALQLRDTIGAGRTLDLLTPVDGRERVLVYTVHIDADGIHVDGQTDLAGRTVDVCKVTVVRTTSSDQWYPKLN